MADMARSENPLDGLKEMKSWFNGEHIPDFKEKVAHCSRAVNFGILADIIGRVIEIIEQPNQSRSTKE